MVQIVEKNGRTYEKNGSTANMMKMNVRDDTASISIVGFEDAYKRFFESLVIGTTYCLIDLVCFFVENVSRFVFFRHPFLH